MLYGNTNNLDVDFASGYPFGKTIFGTPGMRGHPGGAEQGGGAGGARHVRKHSFSSAPPACVRV